METQGHGKTEARVVKAIPRVSQGLPDELQGFRKSLTWMRAKDRHSEKMGPFISEVQSLVSGQQPDRSQCARSTGLLSGRRLLCVLDTS